MKLLAIEKEEARHRRGKLVPFGTDSEYERKATRQVAKQIGLGTITFERAKTIIERADEERKQKRSVVFACCEQDIIKKGKEG
ncbi:MAG: hypothetical protein ACRD32_02510 [Nitrososphaerales archaeon]